MYGIKKNFGFGMMRLPLQNGVVDWEETSRMVDCFLAQGFNYFDTAHGYLEGQSELAVRRCLSSRHAREEYVLTDKLSSQHFHRQEDIRPLFQSELEACGVEYFDFYLMHAQSAVVFEKFKRCNAYETAFELKAEGRVRHVGLSFHDRAEVLDRILTEYPELEVVQLQFNYLDYEDAGVQSRACYEVARRHGKPVIVMEPVKGGQLAQLPPAAAAELDALRGGSYASYAIRYAAGFDGILTVLSGMGSMAMLEDNVSFMKDFRPLDETERAAVGRVVEQFKKLETVPCTACRYCTEGCPLGIPIPEFFALFNKHSLFPDWNAGFYYNIAYAKGHPASACVRCGACEALCPQHLPIRELLVKVAGSFEKKQ